MKFFSAATAIVVSAFMTSTVQATDIIVDVSWSNLQEERWKTDESAVKQALAQHGVTDTSADAQSSSAKQLPDVESLITQVANALIILGNPPA